MQWAYCPLPKQRLDPPLKSRQHREERCVFRGSHCSNTNHHQTVKSLETKHISIFCSVSPCELAGAEVLSVCTLLLNETCVRELAKEERFSFQPVCLFACLLATYRATLADKLS